MPKIEPIAVPRKADPAVVREDVRARMQQALDEMARS